MAGLALGAVGVVYGDIGTSPLYTVQQVFGSHGIAASPQNVLGALSLIFWSLIIVVTVKYVLFIMRADNKGEGGIVALMALAQNCARGVPRLAKVIVMLGLLGAALFYGDGVITPAISVLSAVEGLEVAAPHLQRWVVPITLGVIVSLFWFQRHGTDRIGKVFGPICVLWFLSLASLGVYGVAHHPSVLRALSPAYGLIFFLHNGADAFLALGAVVLAVTGTEALYADMGHFGKAPIRLAWLNFVLPALVLNYFGQGALVLAHPGAAVNPFYHLVPRALLYPMIALATAATVIASQAVISGAFSMTRQAMQLGYLPRMRVLHTSTHMPGQVFLPWINRILLVLVAGTVIGFRSSDNLGAAYGIAVTGTMVVTTLLALIVARYRWHWGLPAIIAIGMGLGAVDLSFFSANLVKIVSGGWFPLVLGLGVFTLMTTWRRGRELLMRQVRQGGVALAPFLLSLTEHPPKRVPGTAVFLTADPFAVPNSLLHNLKHNKVLHDRNILLTVETQEAPLANTDERYAWTPLDCGFGRLLIRHGFAEDANLPELLAQAPGIGGGLDLMDTTFFLSRETVVSGGHGTGMAYWRDKLFAFMTRNALPATAFFGIPYNRLIELGAHVEI
ncbi:MAG: potassium transporter Kup [Rhodanobacteraceae bacterium]